MNMCLIEVIKTTSFTVKILLHFGWLTKNKIKAQSGVCADWYRAPVISVTIKLRIL